MNPEHLVAEHFKKLGYVTAVSVSQNENGFDIVAIRNDRYLTIEVKTASQVTGKQAWRTRVVSDLAKHSEIMAIVLPSGKINFCSMKDHLKCCNQDGDRYVTEMVICDGYG